MPAWHSEFWRKDFSGSCSFDVRPGESVPVIGTRICSPGSGKKTLMGAPGGAATIRKTFDSGR